MEILVDSNRKTFWFYTKLSLFEIIITNEDVMMWQIYLEKRNYTLASFYSKTDVQRSIVFAEEAKNLFVAKKYDAAAAVFAKSDTIAIEEVALMFAKLNEWDALSIYLIKRLYSLSEVFYLFDPVYRIGQISSLLHAGL